MQFSRALQLVPSALTVVASQKYTALISTAAFTGEKLLSREPYILGVLMGGSVVGFLYAKFPGCKGLWFEVSRRTKGALNRRSALPKCWHMPTYCRTAVDVARLVGGKHTSALKGKKIITSYVIVLRL